MACNCSDSQGTHANGYSGSITLGSGMDTPERKLQYAVDALMLAFDKAYVRSLMLQTVNNVNATAWGSGPQADEGITAIYLTKYEQFLADGDREGWFTYLLGTDTSVPDKTQIMIPPVAAMATRDNSGMIWAIVGVIAAAAVVLFLFMRSRTSGRRR